MNKLTIFILFVVLSACVKDKTPGPINKTDDAPNLSHKGYFVLNEGAFTLGNGSLSFYDELEDKMYNNVFQAINNRALGDVVQSMEFYKGLAFIVINNSGTIEVVDSTTFQSIKTINGFQSPRSLSFYESKMFVSDLHENAIAVVDLNSLSIADYIDVAGWTEEMIVLNGSLFVTVAQRFEVATEDKMMGMVAIDLEENQNIVYLPLTQGCRSVEIDENGMIWVLCDGGIQEEFGGIYRIDPNEFEINGHWRFPKQSMDGSSLFYDEIKKEVSFIISAPELGLNAYQLAFVDVDTDSIEPVFERINNVNYLFCHFIKQDGLVLIGEASPRIENGKLHQYDLEQNEIINSFDVGIFPSLIVEH